MNKSAILLDKKHAFDECGLDTAAIAKLRQLGGEKFVADMAALFFQYARSDSPLPAPPLTPLCKRTRKLLESRLTSRYCLSEYLESTGFD